MESDKNRNGDSQSSISHEDSREYPGYTSDKEWRATDELADNDTVINDIEDARLADSGPVRNPNYHDLANTIDDIKNSRISSNDYSSKKGKTLEDFNKTNPQRDINQTNLSSEDSEYTDNDQSGN
jgi:hypothetical protein